MNTDCTLCGQPYREHWVRYHGRFTLWCPDGAPNPVHLGATIEVATQRLRTRCGDEAAAGLVDDFGNIQIAHHIFTLCEARHVTESGCPTCPDPWPVKCTDHGGCDGTLHLTLRNRRSKKVYRRSSQLPSDAVRNAVRNLLVRGYEPPHPSPYEAFAECDHCGSRPSRDEVIQALVA
jgi:hypothetical protein